MLGFIKKVFVVAMWFFGCYLSNVNPLEYVSINSKTCKVRSQIINVNSNESSFYLYSFNINKCSCSYNNINDPYTGLCVPDVAEKTNG